MLSDQEKTELRQTIQANKHEVFLVSVEEMDAIVRSNNSPRKAILQQSWKQLKSKLETGANFTAHGKDAVTLAKLIGDLGAAGARVYVKTYGGKPHIILKGRPGLRKILTGTRYGIKNPKVISMGLGKAGAVSAVKSGGILTVVLLSSYRVADYFLTDGATLSQLIGTLATDVVKVGLAVGASITAVAMLGATTLAIGPLVVALGVGLLATLALEAIDSEFGLTDKVVAGLDELSGSMSNRVDRAKQSAIQAGSAAVDSVIDYVIESGKQVIVDAARRQINKYTLPRAW